MKSLFASVILQKVSQTTLSLHDNTVMDYLHYNCASIAGPFVHESRRSHLDLGRSFLTVHSHQELLKL